MSDKRIWWLSFSEDEGWLGGCIVHGDNIADAIREAWRLEINPGGEVLPFEILSPYDTLIQDGEFGRLYTDKAEVERVFGPIQKVTT